VLICVQVQFRSPDIMFDINEAAVPQDSDVVARRPTSAKEPTRVRVEFPETWLWSESTAGYHLTPAVVYAAAKFGSFSWCQNYL